MFFGYCILFAAILAAAYFFCGMIGGEIMAYLLGFAILVAALAALATIVTKLGDLEEKMDKLMKHREDEGHE